MGDSWGHTLTRLSSEALAKIDRRVAHFREQGYGYDGDLEQARSCTLGRVTHLDRAEYLFTYSYVTGRAGRVSFASKNVCRDHAEKAAAKYGIDLEQVGREPGGAL